MRKFKEQWVLTAQPQYDSFEKSVVGRPDPDKYLPHVIDYFDSKNEAIAARDKIDPLSLNIPFQGYVNAIRLTISLNLVPLEPEEPIHQDMIHVRKLKYDYINDVKKLEQKLLNLKEKYQNLKSSNPRYYNSSNDWIESQQRRINDQMVIIQTKIDRLKEKQESINSINEPYVTNTELKKLQDKIL